MKNHRASIDVLIYSYKNKNLKSIVTDIIDKANNEVRIILHDQNPVDRASMFSEFPHVHYHHSFWYEIMGPTFFANNAVNKNHYEYLFIISDNIKLSSGWDDLAIDVLKLLPNSIVSGSGEYKVDILDNFSLASTNTFSKNIQTTQWIDQNFIGATKNTWHKIGYPKHLKYHGVAETLSVNAFCSGIDILSMPSEVYSITGKPIMESIYVPFSLWHMYNSFIDILKSSLSVVRSVKDFADFHQLDLERIHRLPHESNDVLYDPSTLNIASDNSIRYHAGLKSIY